MRVGLEKKSLRADISGLTEGMIDIDIVHTCYALNNIVENAVNASPKEGVIWISGDTTEDGAYELTVRDEGPGMSAEQIDKALKPFTQGEHALVRSREGLGLGLTLAKHIFRDQQASVRLQSDGRNGTTVTVRFAPPAKAKSDAEKKLRASPA